MRVATLLLLALALALPAGAGAGEGAGADEDGVTWLTWSQPAGWFDETAQRAGDNDFERAWGVDVVQGDPTGFEVCTVASQCQTGDSTNEVNGSMTPRDVAVGPDGNVYAVDAVFNRVQVFSPDGAFLRTFGGGAVDQSGGTLIQPRGIGVGADGHVFVAEELAARVSEFSGDGTFVRLWGRGVNDAVPGDGFEVCPAAQAASCRFGLDGGGESDVGGQFSTPFDVTPDASGNVYVSDNLDNRVQKFGPDRQFVFAVGANVNGDAAAPNRNFCSVAADCRAGEQSGVAGGFSGNTGLGVDPAGRLYVGETYRVTRFSPAGAFELVWGRGVNGGEGPEVCTVAASCTSATPGTQGGTFYGIGGLTVDGQGHVYTGEDNRVQRFDLDGNFQRAFGLDVDPNRPSVFGACTIASECNPGLRGGLGGEFGGERSGPAGPGAAPDGTLFVADGPNRRVQRFSAPAGSAPQPPAAPAVSSVTPASPADDNAPRIRGSAAADTTVTLYGNATCTGTALASGTAAAFATPGIAISVADGTTTTVYATATNANGTSPCSTTSVTYVENTPLAPVRFSTAAVTYDESNPEAVLTVVRNAPTNTAASVNLATAPGTATDPSDYTGRTETVAFAAGESLKTVKIPLVNDALVEENETFTVSLSQPGPGTTLGTPTTATVTIADDDSTLRFAEATASVAEQSGAAVLTVRRAGFLGSAASVGYVSEPGTAGTPADFAFTEGTLSFAAGQAEKTVSVPIVDDAAIDPGETFSVRLRAPTGAVLGAPSEITLTIEDDETIDTRITAAPERPTSDATPEFAFAAVPAQPGATFECWFDSGSPAPCTSPLKPATSLADGEHTFRVRATSVEGQVDPTPATARIVVDTAAPTVALRLEGRQLAGGSYVGPVSVAADATDPTPATGVAEVRCVVDPPSEPATSGDVPVGQCATSSQPGPHTAYAAAVDTAGNASVPAKVTFRITQQPDTEIVSGPEGATAETTPSFSFRSNLAGAGFRCRVDARPVVECASPWRSPALGRGAHTFEVFAVGPDQTADPTPARRAFTVGEEVRRYRCEIAPFRALNTPATANEPSACVIATERDTIGDRPGCSFGDATVAVCTVIPRCPSRARCALRTDLRWADGDPTQVWVLEEFAALNEQYRSRSTNEYAGRVCATQTPSAPCSSLSSTVTGFGDDGNMRLQCSARRGEPIGTLGPDASRRLTCEATVTITPADAIDTEIVSGPEGLTSTATPSFAFHSSVAGSSFRCRVDTGPVTECASPWRSPLLEQGPHTFEVFAVGPDATADPTPARRAFTVGTEVRRYRCEIAPFRATGPGSGTNRCSFTTAVQTIDPSSPACIDFSGAVAKCTVIPDCPIGARCTLRTEMNWADDDPQVWNPYAFAELNRRDRPVHNTFALVDCRTTETANGCTAVSTVTGFGVDGSVWFLCESNRPHPRTELGPDAGRRLTCDATLTIVPAAALATATQGTAVAAYAPGPGRLSLSPALSRGRSGALAAIAKRKPRLFKAVSRRVTAAGPVALKLKLSKRAKRTLKRKRKLPVPARLSFRPADGGATITRNRRLVLKPVPRQRVPVAQAP